MFVKIEERVQPYRESSHPSLDEASKLLLKAADMLESGALVWGAGDDGTSCAYMAMVYAVDPQAISTPLSTVAAYRFSERAFSSKSVATIFRWNDAKGRTKEEVVAKLRAVALGG